MKRKRDSISLKLKKRNMNKRDNMSELITLLLKCLKKCSYIETGDDKYSVYLLKESESTSAGKTYTIVINDLTWDWFIGKGDVDNDK